VDGFDAMLIKDQLFFPKGGTHYTDLPFRVPSSHAAPHGLLYKGLTAARQIRSFFSPLLEKNNNSECLCFAVFHLLRAHQLARRILLTSPLLTFASKLSSFHYTALTLYVSILHFIIASLVLHFPTSFVFSSSTRCTQAILFNVRCYQSFYLLMAQPKKD
jgi:hypothetical protein